MPASVLDRRQSIGAGARCARRTGRVHYQDQQLAFFETFFKLCQHPIPYGPGYDEWAAKTRDKMSTGKEIYLLGTRAAAIP